MSQPFSEGPSVRKTVTGPLDRSTGSHETETAERLRRLAALAAVGETSLAPVSDPAELSTVLAEVARLRRKRLVSFIARALAQDIHGGREQT